MKKIVKMKVLELIRDWALWPRWEAQELDATNLSRIKEGLRAGVQFPPIIIDAKSNRIVDGFHRQEAIIDIFGEDAQVEVEKREYANDTAMFMEAARLNSIQGLPLSPRDKAHVILKLRKSKVPWPAVAETLGMTDSKAKDFLAKRTAKTTTGMRIPLPYGANSLAGKQMNKEEEHFARTSNGTVPTLHMRLLLNALRADAVKLNEEQKELAAELIERLSKLI